MVYLGSVESVLPPFGQRLVNNGCVGGSSGSLKCKCDGWRVCVCKDGSWICMCVQVWGCHLWLGPVMCVEWWWVVLPEGKRRGWAKEMYVYSTPNSAEEWSLGTSKGTEEEEERTGGSWLILLWPRKTSGPIEVLTRHWAIRIIQSFFSLSLTILSPLLLCTDTCSIRFNNITFILIVLLPTVVSAIFEVNRKGARTVPCGTPGTSLLSQFQH